MENEKEEQPIETLQRDKMLKRKAGSVGKSPTTGRGQMTTMRTPTMRSDGDHR